MDVHEQMARDFEAADIVTKDEGDFAFVSLKTDGARIAFEKYLTESGCKVTSPLGTFTRYAVSPEFVDVMAEWCADNDLTLWRS